MKKAGCIRVRYGVESGDENILRNMNKGVTIDQVRKAFKLTRDAGLETFAYFMIGYLNETPKTMKKTISLAKELNPDWIMFTAATPLPKTEMHEQAVKLGIMDKNYWRDFTLGKRSDRIPYLVKDADKWIDRAYKEVYFRPKFIFNKLMRMDSLSGKHLS